MADFGRVVGRAIERGFVQLVVLNGNSEARAEGHQLGVVDLFLLVGDVAAFAAFAQAVPFDGLGQDDRRRSGVLDRGLVGGIDLQGIVSAQPHPCDLLVAEVLHHLQQPGIGTEEVLPEVSPAFDEELLILSIAQLAHAPHQQTVAVFFDELVPVGAPDDLDDVPPCTAEAGLQLLDDLAVAPHRPVQPLQIAVDDEDQIIEPFARSQRDGAQRLRLIGLTVADERPDLALVALFEAASPMETVGNSQKSFISQGWG